MPPSAASSGSTKSRAQIRLAPLPPCRPPLAYISPTFLQTFHHLPPSGLHSVFTFPDVLRPDALALNKHLLSHALTALFIRVTLGNVDKLGQFAFSLIRQPSMMSAVRMAVIRDHDSEEYGESEWSSGGGLGARQLPDLLRRKRWGEDVPCAPKVLCVCTGFLQDLFSLLNTLAVLHLRSEPLIVPLFKQKWLALAPLSSLRRLDLLMAEDEDYGDEELAPSILPNICRHLPQLSRLRLATLGTDEMPLDLLNMPGRDTYLPPRAFQLEALKLHFHGGLLRPEFRNLASPMSCCLTSLDLSATFVSPDFSEDLARLPPSLINLHLFVGFGCCADASSSCKHTRRPLFLRSKTRAYTSLYSKYFVSQATPSATKLSMTSCPVFPPSNFWKSPNTPHSPSRLSVLSSPVPILLLLVITPALAVSVAVATTARAPLLPPLCKLHNLTTLTLSICNCGDRTPRFASIHASKRKRPVWPEGFGYSDAKALLRECDEIGVSAGWNDSVCL